MLARMAKVVPVIALAALTPNKIPGAIHVFLAGTPGGFGTTGAGAGFCSMTSGGAGGAACTTGGGGAGASWGGASGGLVAGAGGAGAGPPRGTSHGTTIRPAFS